MIPCTTQQVGRFAFKLFAEACFHRSPETLGGVYFWRKAHRWTVHHRQTPTVHEEGDEAGNRKEQCCSSSTAGSSLHCQLPVGRCGRTRVGNAHYKTRSQPSRPADSGAGGLQDRPWRLQGWPEVRAGRGAETTPPPSNSSVGVGWGDMKPSR